ncbi:hypothetical protein [Sulfuriroseicoccus oceanibius]|uniref:Lipoprotein n=1 Tax=Sulfuriroseicoccus oceanibius TaxID=2707525 RepID=A0A6B3LCK7_9BACT|nr:hypothetical protein [Sulfuriroseicoccus oceanibius]QQL46019.1 hypothetical protein G3M56_005415 [Sulfuriroseicoccus oceanibius]
MMKFAAGLFLSLILSSCVVSPITRVDVYNSDGAAKDGYEIKIYPLRRGDLLCDVASTDGLQKEVISALIIGVDGDVHEVSVVDSNDPSGDEYAEYREYIDLWDQYDSRWRRYILRSSARFLQGGQACQIVLKLSDGSVLRRQMTKYTRLGTPL